MPEPAELTKLRDTLPRARALEAFRHLRERDPSGDDELDAFIEDYVRDAYADGVEDWDATERVESIQRRSMDAPLGKKLRAAGYDSLWSYITAQGFDEIDRFRSDLDSETLAPIGFYSYVVEVANEDAKWEFAFRVLATDALNTIRRKPKRDFIAFMAIHRIASYTPKDITWIKAACDFIVDKVQHDSAILESVVSWDDKWLVDLTRSYAEQSASDSK